MLTDDKSLGSMSLVSRCPKCHELVTIHDGLDPEAEVRCPLCLVVYPLRDALAELPPALIPVDTGAIAGPRPDSDALAQSDLITERFHVPGPDDVVLQSGEGSGLPQTETESAEDEAYRLEDWQQIDVAPAIDTGTAEGTSPAIDTGQTPVDSDALATFRIEESGEYEPLADGPSIRVRRKKEKGALRFLAEVFLGGVVGLTVGYYVLCWVVGPRHGLPELPLPLLPHTMHWFKAAAKPDEGAAQPPAGEPDTPKRQPEARP